MTSMSSAHDSTPNTSNGYCFTGYEDPAGDPVSGDLVPEDLGIDADRREGIVVHGHDQLGGEKIGRSDRVLDTHGVVVADGQQGHVEAVQLADELHVREEAGIPRVVHVLPSQVDDKAVGV